MKGDLLTLALMAGGGILGSIVQETVKSSVDIDDAYVSMAASAGTLFLASKIKGDIKHVITGASTVMAMNAISETANLVASKTTNPTVNKLVELLPRVSAPNLLASPSIAAPVDNFIEDAEYVDDSEGVNGLTYSGHSVMDMVV